MEGARERRFWEGRGRTMLWVEEDELGAGAEEGA